MIGRGSIVAAPDLIAKASRGGADVGVAVVPIDTPRAQHALHIAIVAGPSNVIHDLVAPILDDGRANFGRERIQHLVPAHALPFALATLASTLEGIENTFGIVNLIQRGRPFGAVAPPAAGMVGIALETAHAPALLVDIGQQPAGGLAVEADCRNDRIVFLQLARPSLRVVLYPIIPAFGRRARCQVAHPHRLPGRSTTLP